MIIDSIKRDFLDAIYKHHRIPIAILFRWDEGDKHAYEMSPHDNRGYIPEVCVRPEYCDLEFCQLLLKAGERIPFGDWNGARKGELRRL